MSAGEFGEERLICNMEFMSKNRSDHVSGLFLRVWILACFVLLLAGLPAPVQAAGQEDFCHASSLQEDMKAFFIPPVGYLRRTSQGMCVAGRYIIYTRYSSDSASTSYVVLDKEKGTVAGCYNFYTRHSNSLTYNPSTGHVVCVSNKRAYVMALEGSQLRMVAVMTMPRNFCKVAYVARKGGYYLGTSTGIFFSKDLKKFNRLFSVPKVAVNQGMACDGDYLYINWYKYQHNLICKYSLEGKYIGSYTLDSSVYREVEEVDFDSGKMYVNVINSPSNGIYIIQNGHVLQTWQTEKEASCGEDGMMVSTCSRCGKKIEKVIPAQGNHELSGWGVLKAPTCLEEGLKGRICKKCHKVFDQQSIPCTGHSFGGWKLKKKATTRSEGSVERICQICHQVETRKIPVKAK